MTQLVSTPTYLDMTGDPDALNTDALLVRAQTRAERECRRPFSYGQYTETLYVYPDGCVSPTVTPIGAIASPEDTYSQGDRVFLGYLNPTPYVIAGGFNSTFPPQATITYTGGWTAETLPEDLSEAICRIAYRMGHPNPFPTLPVGVSQASVGDVRLQATGPIDGFAVIDDTTRRLLGRYRHRQVRGWQSTPILVGAG